MPLETLEFLTVQEYLKNKKIEASEKTIEALNIELCKITGYFKLSFKKINNEFYFTKIVISFYFKELRSF
jgi:hypothetical protein